MKMWIISIVIVACGLSLYAMRGRYQKPANLIATEKMSFYDLTIPGLEGGTLTMKDYQGKYILCVNVASKCGFTPQYKGLQELYTKYQDKLMIIGFPCNQFLGQEPGTGEEIADFCERNYGVTFPISEKIDVKGVNQHPIYQWLTRKDINGVSDATIKWNFHKVLISPEGEWLQDFSSRVEPMDDSIVSLIK